MSLESTNARMDALGSHILTYGRPLTVAEITQHIDAVDSAALVRVAKRIFAGRPTMAAMGPTRRLLRVDDIAARIGLSRVLQQA
jgi:predicted Zn-dependent peptidase